VLVLLPLAALALLVVAARRSADGWRGAALAGAVAWGALLTAITELLSAVGRITPGWLGVAWTVVTGAVAAWITVRGQWPARGTLRFTAPAPADRWLAGAVAAVALTTLVTASATVPNTFDSMTYHLSRVAQWLQWRDVNPYPTHVLRQLHQAPWAEYAILHLQALAGTDRAASLVQWLAFAGCIAGASRLARQLGGGATAQVLAATYAATLPMALLQATSTQNDLTVAFWLTCLASFVVDAARLARGTRAPPTRRVALLIGAATGLAVLTKPTAYFFAFPFLAWLGVALVAAAPRRAWASLALMAALGAALAGGHWSRNVAVYGKPLGPGAEGDRGELTYAMERRDPAALASNVVRNAALHLGSPSGSVNGALTRAVRRAHRWLGLRSADPRTTWMAHPFGVPALSRHEDEAGNPLHFLLALAAAVGLAVRRRALPREGWAYAGGVLAGAALFVVVLKWQPWASRLQLPLFVLAAPLVGVAIVNTATPRVARLVAALLLAAGLPWIFFGVPNSLLGPRSVLTTPAPAQYFANWRELQSPYEEAVRLLRESRCGDVGFVGGWNAYDYPLWALLRRGDPDARLRHVLVRNASAAWERDARPPCAVVRLYPPDARPLVVSGRTFRRAWAVEQIEVLLPADAPSRGPGSPLGRR
jgi:hypothetical protein